MHAIEGQAGVHTETLNRSHRSVMSILVRQRPKAQLGSLGEGIAAVGLKDLRKAAVASGASLHRLMKWN
ncbi:unnamed protein product [Boreogadus saida]